MASPSLFDETPPRALREHFESFHRENPHVYGRLVEMAREAKRRGIEKWGMKRLFEVIRWEHAIRTRGECVKLNNNYTAFYARRVMADHPDLDGFFETRTSIADT